MAEGPDPKDLARAVVALNEWAQENAAPEDPEHGLSKRLREHLGGETDGLPVVSRGLEGYQRANFQVAIDAFLSADGREAELVGLPMMEGYRIGLAELVKSGHQMHWMPEAGGPIEYEPVDVGERRITCVAAGLWLIRDGEQPLVLMLRRSDHGPRQAELGLEIIARERAVAEELLAELEHLMVEHNPYRGLVLELSGSPWGGVGVEVRPLPTVTRDRIVYPDGVLDRIERHTKTFSEHADALRAAGRHLKRGILLHGPPGTGKTLTVMYLARLMPERTVLLLSGNGLGAVGAASAMARELAPAMLVLEDVDLVAEDRTNGRPTSLLFELLNQMDGLNEDVDLVFVLTTNRPEVIEPALASRPGRVDLAVRMPLPDETGRMRLLNLYAEGLELDLNDEASFITATAGATPAFIREVLRRAALLAVERGDGTRVDDELLASAVEELREGADQLTSNLLGAHLTVDDQG
ncbi:MAG: 26S protease regulatory subunit [Actinobacteria bacterium]|nr:26S protease regulatory subunit [Actinomycetota bacterium]